MSLLAYNSRRTSRRRTAKVKTFTETEEYDEYARARDVILARLPYTPVQRKILAAGADTVAERLYEARRWNHKIRNVAGPKLAAYALFIATLGETPVATNSCIVKHASAINERISIVRGFTIAKAADAKVLPHDKLAAKYAMAVATALNFPELAEQASMLAEITAGYTTKRAATVAAAAVAVLLRLQEATTIPMKQIVDTACTQHYTVKELVDMIYEKRLYEKIMIPS